MRDLSVVARGLFVAALGLLSSCGMRASLQLWHASFLFSSCGWRAPERTSSVVVAHGLSYPAACGILVPQPGIEPAYPALEGRFFTTGPRGKSLEFFLIEVQLIYNVVPISAVQHSDSVIHI